MGVILNALFKHQLPESLQNALKIGHNFDSIVARAIHKELTKKSFNMQNVSDTEIVLDQISSGKTTQFFEHFEEAKSYKKVHNRRLHPNN